MKYPKLSIKLIVATYFLGGCAAHIPTDERVDRAAAQTHLLLKEVNKVKEQNEQKNLVAPRTIEAGQLKLVPSRDWTSGFFAGNLWYLYELTGDNTWKEQAQLYTSDIEKEKFNAGTHDMGFKIYCSYGNAYRLTHNQQYRDIIVKAAQTLSTRYNAKVGAIRSWDHNQDKWEFPVIIDNMMNLELLFEATKLTGDSSFYQIAVAHANTTMKNHFREDFSSWHVIDYDPKTGTVVHRHTHQGYAHHSAWARGQAWALYGYTMCYRETHDPRYLQQAEAVAAYIFNHPHLPSDLIPYWDFDAPSIPAEPRDVSAATITASALYELSTFDEKNADYRAKADTIMRNIKDIYASQPGANKGFILGHSTGSKPSDSEVDVSLIYADYYYLEAILREKMMVK
ncbi:MAG TPA: glycoside hydrolase family 88 protein [Parapedobacter sp.]|uniref:glycoside hydrolase family 88 protein n=1 Tax=Parapedobacter sp. TaxID=1958893 RepID=UPI002C5D513D|nr:glycoside hydrolase family 88 protein [Parapedobacter sp.]HWK57650.1 glycoside hydrolase family 88 protein [Parapedobacter sp.]